MIFQRTLHNIYQSPEAGQMSEDKFVENFYDTTAYTADISTKMRIPEHINAHGSYRYTGVSTASNHSMER